MKFSPKNGRSTLASLVVAGAFLLPVLSYAHRHGGGTSGGGDESQLRLCVGEIKGMAAELGGESYLREVAQCGVSQDRIQRVLDKMAQIESDQPFAAQFLGLFDSTP